MGLFNTTSRAKASFKSKAILNSTIKDNYYSCDKCGGSNLMKHGTSLTCDCDDCGCTRTCSWTLQYYYKDNNSANIEVGSISIEPGDTTTTIVLPTVPAPIIRLDFELGLLGIDVQGNSPVELTAQTYSGSGYISAATIPAPHDLVSNTNNFIADLAIESLAGTYQVVVELETDCGNVNVTFEYTTT